MIPVTKSATADTRTCDFANVTKETLLTSSRTHIGDVAAAMSFFSAYLFKAAAEHDYDKLTAIDKFHKEFVGGFKETTWWDAHRKMHRHHLAQIDGVPENVNLLDVLEYISDCVMAGMARSGKMYELWMSPELLEKAFKNTVDLLKAEVVLVKESNLLPYQQRVVDEAEELNDKLVKLTAFINGSPVFQKLSTGEQLDFGQQELYMTEYLTVLNRRISAFTPPE